MDCCQDCYVSLSAGALRKAEPSPQLRIPRNCSSEARQPNYQATDIG